MAYVSLHKAAILTGVADETVRSLVRRGKIPVHEIPGKRWLRILESDLHLIQERKRRATNRVAGSDFGEHLLTVAEAAKEAGVIATTVLNLIHEGTLQRVRPAGANAILIHRRDLPKIVATKAFPEPGDPSPEEIRRRASKVRLMRQTTLSPRELQRSQIMRLLTRQGGLTAHMVAAKLKCDRNTALERLKELEAVGLVESVGDSMRRFFLPGEVGAFAGMETADTILARFRDHAIRVTRNRHRQAIAA